MVKPQFTLCFPCLGVREDKRGVENRSKGEIQEEYRRNGEQQKRTERNREVHREVTAQLET